MDVFEFLAAKNSSNLPRVNNKPKGLISIFLRPLPKGYAGNINAELCSSYATMHEFIEEFYQEAHAINEKHKQALVNSLVYVQTKVYDEQARNDN